MNYDPVVETRNRMRLEYYDCNRAPCYRTSAEYVRVTMLDSDGCPKCKPELMTIIEYHYRHKGVRRPPPSYRDDGFLVLRKGYG